MKRTFVHRLLTALAAIATAVSLSASPANAAVVITFDNSGASGGTIAYGGAGGPATGSGITFDIVTVGANPDLTCVGCVLNFTTGNNTLDTPFVWTWAGGGSFVNTGTILDPSNGNVVVASGVLLSGSFAGPVPAIASVGAGFAITLSGSGIDTKNADLLAYFGLSPNDFIYASTNITGEDCVSIAAGNSFSCGVVEADVTNTQQGAAPEPATLTLFGLGLLGVGSAARRRLAARK
jgi:hypothetical protein